MTKTILITGAAGNLGQACIDYFLNEGSTVVAIVSKRNTQTLKSSEKLHLYTADLTNETEVDEMVEEVTARYKFHAGLFLAGGFSAGTIDTTDGALMHRMLSMNFETAFFISRALFLQMKKQKNEGYLVFVSSQTGINPSQGKGAVAYTLSKSLLAPYAKILEEEGRSFGIKPVVIAPKTIDTPQNREAMPGADFSTWTTPEGIALEIAKILKGDIKDQVITV